MRLRFGAAGARPLQTPGPSVVTLSHRPVKTMDRGPQWMWAASVGLSLVLSGASGASAQGQPPPSPGHTTSACAQGPIGPTLDPIAGQRVSRDELDCLPSGRHLGAVVDVWFNQIINQQVSGGGMAFFDPVRFSSHGRSWRQTRFHLDGIDITDPARPGEPLFELPYAAWDGLAYQSLWTARPGVNLDFRADAPTPWMVAAATGADVGGGTWLPNGLFDREPATAFGATPERRRLRPVAELSVGRVWTLGDTSRLRLIGSFTEHDRRYPTLRSVDGRNVVDDARRATFALRHEVADGRTRMSTTVFGQTGGRSHEGAQYRWERPLTLETSSHVAGGHFKWTRPAAKLAWFAGVTMRRDDERPNDQRSVLRDLESEWLYLARPRDAEDLGRWKVDAGGDWAWRSWQIQARGTYSRIDLDVHARSSRGVSYLRGPARGWPVAHQLQLGASDQRHRLWGREARVDAARRFLLGGLTLQVVTALDHSAVGARGGRRVGYWSPAGGATLRTGCGRAECFALVRHEPVSLTRDVSEFLSSEGATSTNVWNDGGDLVPDAREAGVLLARQGGAFHAAGRDLRRPSASHFAFGLRTPQLGAFRAVATGVGRWLSQRYTVRLADPSVYAPVEVETVGGERVTAFAKDLTSAGQETYLLVNDADRSRFLGMELQLHTEMTRRWFLNLTASGYWVLSHAPFGSFADRNDPGAISEITADPNARLNARGRVDNDRAYGATLLVGRELIRDLWLSTATRYLDGQPFAQIDVVDTLPQGPVAVMTTPRGTPGPRHTFHMTTDVRLAYVWRGQARHTLAMMLDVFNLLGSGTEIVEDPRAGPAFRRALEMIPGRSILLTVQWRGLTW